MSVLPSLLFGISASLDALLVGCALGLQKVPLPVKHNLLISAVTLIGTVISISLGNLLLPLIPSEIANPDRKQYPDPVRALLCRKMAGLQMALQFFR